MHPQGRRTALLSGSVLAAVAIAGACYWPEGVLRYRCWRYGREPAAFLEALNGASSDPFIRQTLERFVRTREGAARLIAAFLEGYEQSCADSPTFLAEMDKMLLAVHRVTRGPNQESERWEIPLAFVWRVGGGLTSATGQYHWSTPRTSLNPAVLEDLLSLAVGSEVPLPVRPGMKGRVLDLGEARKACAQWPDPACQVFRRPEGMPSFVILLERT